MGLEFTTISDLQGAAIYFLHDGSEHNKSSFTGLMSDVQRRTKKQCVLLDSKSEDGMKIRRFYALKGTHFVIIVRDNDQLHHVWSDGEHFDASKIAFTAEQAG